MRILVEAIKKREGLELVLYPDTEALRIIKEKDLSDITEGGD